MQRNNSDGHSDQQANGHARSRRRENSGAQITGSISLGPECTNGADERA
jgi:hypothetical protein